MSEEPRHKPFPFAPREAPVTPPPVAPSRPSRPEPEAPRPEPLQPREPAPYRPLEFGSMNSPPERPDMDPVYVSRFPVPENTAFENPALGWVAGGIILLLVLIAGISPLLIAPTTPSLGLGGLRGGAWTAPPGSPGAASAASRPAVAREVEQTCARLESLKTLVDEETGSGSPPISLAALQGLASSSPVRQDGWGNDFRLSGFYIVSPGKDGEFATADDFWINWKTGANSPGCDTPGSSAYEVESQDDAGGIEEAAGAMAAARTASQ